MDSFSFQWNYLFVSLENFYTKKTNTLFLYGSYLGLANGQFIVSKKNTFEIPISDIGISNVFFLHLNKIKTFL